MFPEPDQELDKMLTQQMKLDHPLLQVEEAVLGLEEGKAQEDVKPLQLQNAQSHLINMKNMCTMTTNTIISFIT